MALVATFHVFKFEDIMALGARISWLGCKDFMHSEGFGPHSWDQGFGPHSWESLRLILKDSKRQYLLKIAVQVGQT